MQFCVWSTDGRFGDPYVVKVVAPGTEEAEIYDYLHQLDPASPNHTLPCDVIRGEHTLLIMPSLSKVYCAYDLRSGTKVMLDHFRQVLEVSPASMSLLERPLMSVYIHLLCNSLREWNSFIATVLHIW